jgi:hypothetical protein
MPVEIQKTDTKEENALAVKDLSAVGILTELKHLLRNSIYDDEDFRVRNGKVHVNLCYDTKGVIDNYKLKIRDMFSDIVSMRGTRIQVTIQNKKGEDHGKSNVLNIKEDRQLGQGKESPRRNAGDTIRRK